MRMGPMLARVTKSPQLNTQPLTVYRSSGHFGRGKWIEDIPSPATLTVQGIAYPSSQRELDMVPEGDREIAEMTFLTTEQLFTTHRSGIPGTSDQVEWPTGSGEKYRLLYSNPWMQYGFWLSIGTRMAGN